MADSIDEIIGKYSNTNRNDLLDALQDTQDFAGYLSEEVITKIGKHFNLASAKIYGIASFYDQFRFLPQGKFHIKMCNGTACHLSESKPIQKELEKLLKIKAGQTTRDGLFSIEEVACLGSCGLAPVIAINGEFYPSMKPAEIRDILDNLKKSDA